MQATTLTLHREFSVAPVDERIYGGFLEHLGRAVYQGVYEPDSPHADEHGFRRDVLDALAGLRMTAMRYPGGNFASGYHWTDGIGPKSQRPTLRELAWQSLEPNHFGTDEFLTLCGQMSWTPMMTVNLGTGTPEEAGAWVDYCNSPVGAKWSNLRASNGRRDPWGVKLWCLGNEMDGQWQIGHVPADQYAIRAQQAAKIMKDMDPTIETVLCGTCGFWMPTYLEWDRAVLQHCGDFVDHLSVHRYVGNRDGDSPNYLAEGVRISRHIQDMDVACRFVQAQRKSKKRVTLAFDEWNVWYRANDGNGRGVFAPHLLEEVYNVEDAMVAAGFLMAFLRHADAVKIANLAQIVNVIAPIMTDGDKMVRQTIYWAFEMLSKRRTGVSLTPAVRGPQYESKTDGKHDGLMIDYVDTAAIFDGEKCCGGDGAADAKLHVFLANRSLDESAEVRIRLLDKSLTKLVNGDLLTGDKNATNTIDNPDNITPKPLTEIVFKDGEAVVKLPPLGLAAMTLAVS